MQATVSRFHADTRSGAVILDDGAELSFASDALAGTGLRFLRPGQRVSIDLDEEGGPVRVLRVQILTLP